MNKYRIVKAKEAGTYKVQRYVVGIGPLNIWLDDDRCTMYRSSYLRLNSVSSAENHVRELRLRDSYDAEYKARQKAWNAGEVVRTYD